MSHNSHIIFSYAFDQNGNARKLDNSNAAREIENDGLAWVHLDANHGSTKTWLEQEVSYLDHLIIDALVAEETRPRMIEFENGFLVILRGVNLNESSEPEDMVSIRMWIDEERVISIQRRDMRAVYDVCQHIESGKVIKSSGEFLYNLLYKILSNISPFLYGLNEKVDLLEERIMTTHNIKLREEILQIRSQSAVFKRYLAPQKEVIAKLRTSDYEWIGDWSRRHFQENLDQTTHMIEEVDEAINRSQILHDELGNSLSENLNKNMYKISLITVIFMPLTFITGLFGMNVGGIPGKDNPIAFYICAFFMLAAMVMHILFFKKKNRL